MLGKNMELLKIDRAFTSRYLNEGFSGGEKKRAEILQLAMLAAGLRRARRDRLGARHRRAADRLRRRERHARRRARLPDHHPLHAHPRVREARLRAHHARRPDRARGRLRAGRRARGQGLRVRARRGRPRVPPSFVEDRRSAALEVYEAGACPPGAAPASGPRACASSTSTRSSRSATTPGLCPESASTSATRSTPR